MQLFQLLGTPKVTRSGAEHELALIDFDRTGWIRIATTAPRLALPSNHADIELRDTIMTHGPYCGGSVVYRRRGFGWLVCDNCGRLWERPLEAVTLGELVEHHHSRGFVCAWRYSKLGTAPL